MANGPEKDNLEDKRIALLFLGLICLVVAVPVALTWRQVRQDRLNRALIAAIKHNASEQVVSLLNDGADPNSKDEPTRHPPMWRLLMEQLQNRRPVVSHTATALNLALGYQPFGGSYLLFTDQKLSAKAVKALIEHGAQVDTPMDGVEPILLAAALSKRPTVSYLLSHYASVRTQNQPGFIVCHRQDVSFEGNTTLLVHGDMTMLGVSERRTSGPRHPTHQASPAFVIECEGTGYLVERASWKEVHKAVSDRNVLP
jgi:hypothetical protein